MSGLESQKQAPSFFTSSLSLAASNYAFRCDAKLADKSFLDLELRIRSNEFYELGDFLPVPFVKGVQPDYLDFPTDDSVRVISTLAIQNLCINERDCRHISRDDFDDLNAERQLSCNDVLLTVDGGVSIGKPAHFDRNDDFTVDSHVCNLSCYLVRAHG